MTFLETTDPERLTRAQHAMIVAARQLFDTLSEFKSFDTIPLDAGDLVGVEVTLSPLNPSPRVSITHIDAQGVRRVLAHVAVAEPTPAAH
jgi:hypothetical protein